MTVTSQIWVPILLFSTWEKSVTDWFDSNMQYLILYIKINQFFILDFLALSNKSDKEGKRCHSFTAKAFHII